MNRKQKRLAIAGAALCIAGLAAALMLTALRGSISYFYMPADIAAAPTAPSGPIRLGGLVAAGSVVFADGDETIVDFVVEDGAAQVPVSYKGVLPDLFREGQGVVVQGRLDETGRLIAAQVLAKHDETYMPREVADALKEQGVWREDGALRPR